MASAAAVSESAPSSKPHNPSSSDSKGLPKVTLPLKDILNPLDTDVLCGRGGAALRHPGNQTYRNLVNLNKGLYITCLKAEKLKISRSIVAAIREQNGRFLERDGKKGIWFDIGDKKALEKTSQALREGQPKLRQKIVELGNKVVSRKSIKGGSGSAVEVDLSVDGPTTLTASNASTSEADLRSRNQEVILQSMQQHKAEAAAKAKESQQQQHLDDDEFNEEDSLGDFGGNAEDFGHPDYTNQRGGGGGGFNGHDSMSSVATQQMGNVGFQGGGGGPQDQAFLENLVPFEDDGGGDDGGMPGPGVPYPTRLETIQSGQVMPPPPMRNMRGAEHHGGYEDDQNLSLRDLSISGDDQIIDPHPHNDGGGAPNDSFTNRGGRPMLTRSRRGFSYRPPSGGDVMSGELNIPNAASNRSLLSDFSVSFQGSAPNSMRSILTEESPTLYEEGAEGGPSISPVNVYDEATGEIVSTSKNHHNLKDPRNYFASLKRNPPRGQSSKHSMHSNQSHGDGMPSIQMQVDSTPSMISNFSSIGPGGGGMTVASEESRREMMRQLAIAQQQQQSPLEGKEAVNFESKRSIMSLATTNASKRSIMSAMTDGGNTLFSNLSNDIGHVSTRSIAMSDFSEVEEDENKAQGGEENGSSGLLGVQPSTSLESGGSSPGVNAVGTTASF